MRQLRIIINIPGQEKPIQLFSPTLEQAKAELKKWADKGHHGKYQIIQTLEVLAEEGEC